jgi:hypothetical protein
MTQEDLAQALNTTALCIPDLHIASAGDRGKTFAIGRPCYSIYRICMSSIRVGRVGSCILPPDSATYSGGGQDAKANQNSSSVETVFRWRRCDFLG